MDPLSIETLNAQFSIPGQVKFAAGPGGLTTAIIENARCSAAVTLAGGHVIAFQPVGQPDLFWMSPNSAYAVGQPLRGGIPICWPWFGPHPAQPSELPMHGFARLLPWTVQGSRALPDGSCQVSLTLKDTAQTLSWWPHAFELVYTITCGSELSVDLAVHNPGPQPFRYNAALHHYFKVADARKISVYGLEDTDYLDKVDQFARKHQVGPVTITAQTDRIYLDTTEECMIDDPVLRRKTHIAKTGSRTTVVWNPAERAGQMPDVGAGNEAGFVCVESANAADDEIVVEPGATAHLTARIWAAEAP